MSFKLHAANSALGQKYEREYKKYNPTGDEFHDQYADNVHQAEAGKHIDRAAHHWDHLSGDETHFGEGEDMHSAHRRLTGYMKSAGEPKTQEQKERLAQMKYHLDMCAHHNNNSGIKFKKIPVSESAIEEAFKKPLHGSRNDERHKAWAQNMHLHKKWMEAMDSNDSNSKHSAQYYAYHLGAHHANVTNEYGEGETQAMKKHSGLYHSQSKGAESQLAHATVVANNLDHRKLERLYKEKAGEE